MGYSQAKTLKDRRYLCLWPETLLLQEQMAPSEEDTPWNLQMWMHDSGEILILALNNNTAPRGLVKCASTISRHDRDKSESWRTSREQKVKGGGCDVLLREELDTDVTDRGDKWARWQTACAVPRGRRGNSAPLIMRWPSLKKLLLRLPSETFPTSASEIPHTEPDRNIIHFQSEHEHVAVQRKNIFFFIKYHFF